MELIVGLITVLIIFSVIRWLLVTVFRLGAAGVQSAVTGKPIRETLGGYSGELQAEIQNKNTRSDGTGLDYLAVQVRGKFPNSKETDLTFVCSIYDVTDDTRQPVLSLIEACQESETKCFQTTAQVGEVDSNVTIGKWTEIGRIAPLVLQPPYQGIRKLKAKIRLLKTDAVDQIHAGFYAGRTSDKFWEQNIDFKEEFILTGYLEEIEQQEKGYKFILQLGINVAMSDGDLDDAEGHRLQEWMSKIVSTTSESKQGALKESLNSTMRETFEAIRAGTFSKGDAVDKLNDLANNTLKYEAIDLCYAIMAADGVADPAEIELLNKLSEALDLDPKEVDRIRDTAMLDLSKSGTIDLRSANVLGIDPLWTDAEVKKHLRTEFKKWNSRISSLPPGEERDHAQSMLNAIAEARTNYGS